ncbi:MAG: citrate/2-methylcitrate synthase [Lachnospiraceae bacterium]|nr:citrate/2-methylcitrate synthase [Lachnospiraceae bacterium]
MDINEIIEVRSQQKKLFQELYENTMVAGMIDPSLYEEFGVMRGLRDSNGRGVLTGLTEISDIIAHDIVDGKKIPADGRLYYHGYNVVDLLHGLKGRRHAFEESTYLLLFGELPTKRQMEQFTEIMSGFQSLSGMFTRDVIMKAPSSNIMNALQRSLLTLYSYDDNPEDISTENVLRQSLQIIAKMPVIAVYAYHAYRHMIQNKTLLIRNPKQEYSTAENMLYMLRKDGTFTELEARVLDVALVLHAEHGGGNNSTFTTHVVTSSGTDTYSAIAAAIASLKGPRHGGANVKAMEMFSYLKEAIEDWSDEEEIARELNRILNKEVFDKSGLIYGMGHAVYTVSDPRMVVLKSYAENLAKEKGRMGEFEFYDRVERIAKRVIAEHRHLFKPICANVDYYSGFVYDMLEIPLELVTPVFAIARISGWSAHRLEEIVNKGKIIRPAYKCVSTHREYVEIEERKEQKNTI